MDNLSINNSPKLENIHSLEKLYKYLNYEVSSSILYAGSFFIPLLIPILMLAAILFTPFMLFVLYKERKNGWIISFVLMVILPSFSLLIFYPVMVIITLVPFYLFCFIIRMEAKSWITEMRSRNELVLQKIRKANESNEFNDIFDVRN